MMEIFRKEKAIFANINDQERNYNKAVSGKNGLRISALFGRKIQNECIMGVFDRKKSQNECIMEEKKDIVRNRKRM